MTKIYDTIIVGAGPSGLSASIYSAQANFSTLVLGGDSIGGLLNTTDKLNNYLGFQNVAGMELAEKMKQHALDEGVELKERFVTSINKEKDHWVLTLDDESTVESLVVIYAAGSSPRKLGLPNEDMEGVSYCATCDGMFYEGDTVSVVGGGDAALEEALYLSRIAEKVNLLVRSRIRAKKYLQELVEKTSNITVRTGVQVSSISGSDNMLEMIQLSNGEEIPSYGLFISIGQNPNSSIAAPYSELDSENFIKFSKDKSFFIAGDVKNPEYRQAIIAAGDGAKAAIQATNYLLTVK